MDGGLKSTMMKMKNFKLFMKAKRHVLIGAGITALVTGCASNPTALAPVGPAAGQHAVAATKGYLQVFSATEKSIPFASDDPTLFDLHTGYDINDATGKNVEFVANHMSNMDEWPDTVSLPAGTYNIVAKSACCGLVTVPVVIASGKTTTVHLDRNWWPPAKTSTNNLVFLPDGEAVGWSSSIAKSLE
jgi:hypothetical protein